MRLPTGFRALSLIVGLAVLGFTGCKPASQIDTLSFVEKAQLTKTCSAANSQGKGRQIHHVTILQLTNGMTAIRINRNACGTASGAGLALAGAPKGASKSPKTMVIWAPMYGTSDHDSIEKTGPVADRLQAKGYTVVRADNSYGDGLQEKVRAAMKANPGVERAIVVTNGHGSMSPVIDAKGNPVLDADGNPQQEHTIGISNKDGTADQFSTNREILQPALQGLGLPPEKVVSVVSSCQSGQCIADHGATNPKGAIVTSSGAQQLSWGFPENVVSALDRGSDPASPEFKAMDANKDGTVSTYELKDSLNGNKGGLAGTQVINVLYAGEDGQPDYSKGVGTQTIVNAQTVQAGGPDQTLLSSKGIKSGAGAAPDNSHVWTQEDGEKFAKEAGGGSPTYVDNSAQNYGYFDELNAKATNQLQIQQTLKNYNNDPSAAAEELSGRGASQAQIDGAVIANDNEAKTNDIVDRYGGDPNAAFEELQGSGLSPDPNANPFPTLPADEEQTKADSTDSTSTFGDNGTGNWGLPDNSNAPDVSGMALTSSSNARISAGTTSTPKGASKAKPAISMHHPKVLSSKAMMFSLH